MAIIDKRPLGGQSDINRDRFKKRYKGQIEKAVRDMVKDGSIADDHKGGADIPIKGTSEPHPRHGRGGIHKRVLPGNHDFTRGDKIDRPQGGGGGGGSGKPGQGPDNEDDFLFHLDQEEIMKYFLDDLELPNMAKKHMTQDSDQLERVNAGIASDGPPPRLSIPLTYQRAYPRAHIFGRPKMKQELKKLLKERQALMAGPEETRDQARVNELDKLITALRRKLRAIPFMDTSELRYHTSTFEPTPIAQAVMVCIMDVSGSMDEERKGLAKRFYKLLYLFLKRNYKKIQVVFIRHTTEAEEVDEEKFFYDKLNGGTTVSTGLKKGMEIIKARYNPNEWNVYVAQASDGENWGSDNVECKNALLELLTLVQYYAYMEVRTSSSYYSTLGMSDLWKLYQTVYETRKYAGIFEMRKVTSAGEIYPVFRELFKKRGVKE